jgi:antitoxin component of RelBE/YafQ-DinJ toxin-antitoxin module
MDQITLHIPISKALKQKAESRARKQGVTLAEIIHSLLDKFTKREVSVSIERKDEEVVFLSARAKRRYAKMDEDFRTGKNVYTAKDADDLFRQLRSNK